MSRTKRKPDHDGETCDEAEMVRRLKLRSAFSLRLMQALGCPGPNGLDYCETAKTLGEVARLLGISRRSGQEWKSRGVITETGDRARPLNLTEIRSRRQAYLAEHGGRPGPSERLADPALDLAAGILRVFAVEVPKACAAAIVDAIEEFKSQGKAGASLADAADRVAELLDKRIAELCLDEKQIQAVVSDCQRFV